MLWGAGQGSWWANDIFHYQIIASFHKNALC